VRARLDRADGQRLFGTDPKAYDSARPGHAEEVYEVLRATCGLLPGSKVLEVGPGTGQATHRLLELGADPLVAIEPDPALAEFLCARFEERIEIRSSTLEAAELEDDFDLATAASSFHWVDEAVGLAKIRGALHPGGWVALWWTVFGDANRPDPFHEAIEPLMNDLPQSPSEAKGGRPPFGHDGEARVAALGRAGFDTIAPRRIEWTHTWDTEGIRGLFGSFSPILALDRNRRDALLDAIERVAERDFGGRVTKPVVTALYTARKPP
jgi:SAM-dependent methyltransferase